MTTGHPEEDAGRRFPALWLALVVLGGVGVYALLNSAYFRIERVTVIGNSAVTAERLLEVTGIRRGDLRWRHPTDGVVRRLRSEAWVRDVQVAWKPGELVVNVTERQPLGMLPYYTSFLLVDETGIVLEQVPSLTEAKLPVITGVPLKRALRGESIATAGLADALYLLSWMAEPLRDAVGEINVDERRNITFYVDKIPVMWGRLPDTGDREAATREKLAAFGATLAAAKASTDPVCYIDFRAKQPYFGCKEKPTDTGAN